MKAKAVATLACCLLMGPQSSDPFGWLTLLLPQAEQLHASALGAIRNGVIVDLASIRELKVDGLASVPDSSEVARLIGRPFEELRRDDAVYCSISRRYCGVINDRLLITFDSLKVNGETAEIGVTLITTWRRPTSSGTCSTPSLVVFANQEGRWTVSESRRLAVC